MRTNTNLAASPLSSVPTPNLRWLWHHRIPRGQVTVLPGPPDAAQSPRALDLAARRAANPPLPGSFSTSQTEGAGGWVRSTLDPTAFSPSPSPPLTESPSHVFLLADANAAQAAAIRAPSVPPEAS